MNDGIFRSRPRGYRPREAQAEPTTPPPGTAGPSAPGTPLEPDDEATTTDPPDLDDTSGASS
ncbi:hypothetical protein ACFT4A_14875 [Streptomyces sp. NPDC057099]|uniref:hypothetical protein n=1 Tax=Streptomyces sp. NPDC057099 TaxID=3346019 RepID=UPI003643BA94